MTEAARFRKDIPLLNNSIHYLDNAATSLMPKTVINAVADYDGRIRSNVGRGVYAWAEQATAHYEEARRHIATAVQTKAEEIIFTSGATAALNLLATSLCRDLGSDDSVWLARDNHHSNIVPWQMAAAQKGFALRWLPAEKKRSFVTNTRSRSTKCGQQKAADTSRITHCQRKWSSHCARCFDNGS
jgi:cysteine desulfurase/selenocysteine lyase